MDAPRTARTMWHLLEPLHAVIYFAPEATEALSAAGLRGFWMGYFAGRAAPMGAVDPSVVEATFYNFAPRRVRRAVPDAWSFAAPEQVLDARLVGAGRALERVLGLEGATRPPEVVRAATLARRAVEGIAMPGRPLGAANAALVWPEDPLLALWQAAGVVREHRGDGHIAALVAAGLDGPQALVSMAGTGAVPRAMLQQGRGWEDDEWAAAEEALAARGWLEADGRLSAAGASARAELEDLTDRLAAGPWEQLGADDSAELRGLLLPMAQAAAAGGALPVPNPMGMPAPR